MRSCELFAWADLKLIFLISASQVVRITVMNHQFLAYHSYNLTKRIQFYVEEFFFCIESFIKVFFFVFVFSFFFYYSYVHTRLGSFLPPAPTPSLTTHSAPSLSPPSIPSRNYFALISNFVVERV
jgi:hypothetical protein